MASVTIYLNEYESFELTNFDLFTSHQDGFTATVELYDANGENQSLKKLEELYFEQNAELHLDTSSLDNPAGLRKIIDLQAFDESKSPLCTKPYKLLIVEFE